MPIFNKLTKLCTRTENHEHLGIVYDSLDPVDKQIVRDRLRALAAGGQRVVGNGAGHIPNNNDSRSTAKFIVLSLFIILGIAALSGGNADTAATHNVTQATPAIPLSSVLPPLKSNEDKIALTIAYDQMCQNLPADIMQETYAILMRPETSTAAFQNSTQQVLKIYTEAGKSGFCATYKPLMQRALTAINFSR